MPFLANLVTLIFLSTILYFCARWLVDSLRQEQAQKAAERDLFSHQDNDGDTATLARARTTAVRRSAAQDVRARRVAAAAALVAEATRNRLIVAPALAAVTVLAFAVGGPLPGSCIAGLCALMAMVPLVAHSWLQSLADSALDESGVTSDDPLFVPADWR